MQDFRNLKVWRRAHRPTLGLYRLTKRFPKEELYGLTSQIRRAACSVCANIAEGCGRRGDKEFGRFLYTTFASACELEYHLLLSADLEYLDRPSYVRFNREVVEVKRMISGLLIRLKADS